MNDSIDSYLSLDKISSHLIKNNIFLSKLYLDAFKTKVYNIKYNFYRFVFISILLISYVKIVIIFPYLSLSKLNTFTKLTTYIFDLALGDKNIYNDLMCYIDNLVYISILGYFMLFKFSIIFIIEFMYNFL